MSSHEDLLNKYKMRENTPLGRSLAAMERVYAFLVGLALTNGARRMFDVYVDPGANGKQLDFVALHTVSAFCAFVAMAVTLIPFYQGAHVHLDKHYRYFEDQEPEMPMLLLEVLLILVSSFFFFMCGELVHRPAYFGLAFIGVFLFDLAWALGWLLRGRSARAQGQAAEFAIQSWSKLNWKALAATAVVFFIFFVLDFVVHYPYQWNPDWEQYRFVPILFCAIALVRTGIDYWFHHELYFGQKLEMWNRRSPPRELSLDWSLFDRWISGRRTRLQVARAMHGPPAESAAVQGESGGAVGGAGPPP